jgi:hypothetical protein
MNNKKITYDYLRKNLKIEGYDELNEIILDLINKSDKSGKKIEDVIIELKILVEEILNTIKK